MTYEFVPTEELGPEYDDGTMPANVAELGEQIVGHRIVKVENGPVKGYYGGNVMGLHITLDTGKTVTLTNTDDCCAYTELESFIWNADKVDHVITGVRTAEGYSVWSIFADMADILTLNVGWSSGNPFYYGYGFQIAVIEEAQQ